MVAVNQVFQSGKMGELLNEFIMGVYVIWHKGNIVYVGKDSNIRAGVRYYAHMNPSKKDAQVINNVMQEAKNTDPIKFAKDWKYEVFCIMANAQAIAIVESQLIDLMKPKYNQIGGKDTDI